MLPMRRAIKLNALNLSCYWKTGLNAETNPHRVAVDEDWIICQLTGRSPALL